MKDKSIIENFLSVGRAKRVTGINNIDLVVIGRQKTDGGYNWKYI